MASEDLRGEEIAELLSEIKQRVRARYPASSLPLGWKDAEPVRMPLPDLTPLLHARDAAQAKVASIGLVNPRTGGAVNSLIQFVKKTIARSLGWFVRDQITFNRRMLGCVEALMEAMNEENRALSILAGHVGETNKVAEPLRDLHIHWQEWRKQWERNLATNEMQFLRSVSDLQTGFTHRATLMESNFRETVKMQHEDYRHLAKRNLEEMWGEMEKVRTEYERLIHDELRVIRQRMRALDSDLINRESTLATAPPEEALAFDYPRFADRFRGSEDYVRRNQDFYLAYFRGSSRVLDIGCGRGEFLELLRENGIPARGIELSEESVGYCRSKGLDVEHADLFTYLSSLPEASEDAIFSSQVVEHIAPARLPEMMSLCASRLRQGGLLAIETPNPECLAIFATHFFLDPTHQRPVPPSLLIFYAEEAGLGRCEIHRLSPAADSFPEIRSLPPDFAERFFGGLDYALIARKL